MGFVKTIKTVQVSFKIPGLHCWPNAGIEGNETNNFLQYPHRHSFHISVEVKVSHNERQIEFIQLQNEIEQMLSEKYWNVEKQLFDFGPMSCESIAEVILDWGVLEYPTIFKISVSEDGEFAANIYITHEK